MKKIKKGEYGYIPSQTKLEIIKTVGMYGLSILIFVMGYISTGDKANLLTIVAILGCLPASRNAVNMIMFLRAKGCSQELHDAIGNHGNGLCQLYDLYFTSYDNNYQVSHLVIEGKNVVGISESLKTDEKKCKEHIASLMSLNAFHDYSIKIFKDTTKYCTRLEQLQVLHDKEHSSDKVAVLLQSISL
ncbi:MAG: hypothetical protein R3Y24_00845 [Eubacteriales bacterium]